MIKSLQELRIIIDNGKKTELYHLFRGVWLNVNTDSMHPKTLIRAMHDNRLRKAK